MNPADEQSLYRWIAELTSDYAYAYSVAPDGGVTLEWVSEAFTRVTGYNVADVNARGPAALIHPEDQAGDAAVGARLRAGETQVWEHRLLTRTGEIRWLRDHAGPVWDETHARVIRLVGAAQDITAQKQAEEAQRRGERDLQFAVGAAQLGTFYCDWPFDKIIWNDICKQHFFLAPDADVDFDLFYSLLHPDDRARTRAAIDRAIEAREEYNIEYRVQGPGGEMRWINAVGRATYDAVGVPVRFDGITIDITARKQAERELTEALERETLLNQIGHAIRRASDPEALLQTAVETLGQALGADHCYYVTYDLDADEGNLQPDWHRPGLASLTGQYRPSDYDINDDTSYRLGRTHVVEDAEALGDAAIVRTGLRSLVRAPLAPGKIMTALTVAMADRPRRWTPNEIRLVEAVASQTQAALETARIQQRERRIATALQDALQPPVPADVSRLDVAAYTRPALAEAAIGGDFYDLFALDKELYAIIIGDVSGKGLAAAAQLATVRNMLRGVLYQYRAPAPAVAGLNTVLTAHNLLAGFVTLFVGLYDARTGEIVYTSCGHEPGLLLRAGTGTVELMEVTGMPLGVSENAHYTESAVTLAAGDRLLLYTDGLSEAGPDRRQLLGTNGLVRLLQSAAGQPDLNAAAGQIVSDAHAYAQGIFRDDVCVLFLRRQ